MIEHVAQPREFMRALGALARPGGAVVVSTLARTPRAFALAVVGAEYIINLVPRGTHDWTRFINLGTRPAALTRRRRCLTESDCQCAALTVTAVSLSQHCRSIERGRMRAGRCASGARAEELALLGEEAGLGLERAAGMSYNPLTGRWRLSGDTGVNYIASFCRTSAAAPVDHPAPAAESAPAHPSAATEAPVFRPGDLGLGPLATKA